MSGAGPSETAGTENANHGSHPANSESLVKMANQIETFFASEPDRETAIAAIENHLRRFWDPRMRRAIVAYVEQGGLGLGTLARRAVQRIAVHS